METESAQVDEIACAVAGICNSGADPLESVGRASEDPDIPACGKAFSANLVCTRCQSAFYCTKECQKKAWKFDRHKQLCGGMKEKCGRDAKRLMKALIRRYSEDCIAMERGLLFVFDGAGAYKVAVAEGLHEALRVIFRYGVEHVVELYRKDDDMRVRELRRGDRDGHVWAATRIIMSSLFRGQRVEGRAVLGSRFGCVDGQRIKAYVNSHPEAFDVWMDASIATISLPFDTEVWRFRGPHLRGPFRIDQHTMAHQASRDTSAAWLLVWMDTRASRAILLPAVADDATETAAQAAKTRAHSIANRFGALLKTVNELDERDPGMGVGGMVNQMAAMVAYRVREFGIHLDFNKRLKSEGLDKQRYLQCAVPVGDATIEKGATLTDAEGKAAMAAFASRQQPSRRRR
jgi:hypothetical protein